MSWIVLCIGDDVAGLLLYRSILELDGHNALVAQDTDDALKVSDAIGIDCVVVDCKQDGISVTRGISRARPGIPIVFVSDQPELNLQVYSETSMFVTKDEAIGELSRCVREVIQRGVQQRSEDRRRTILTRGANVKFGPLHEAFVRWLLPW
jgi:DNA-binding response OmpR family regulator